MQEATLRMLLPKGVYRLEKRAKHNVASEMATYRDTKVMKIEGKSVVEWSVYNYVENEFNSDNEPILSSL